jgi:hypothetical protein
MELSSNLVSELKQILKEEFGLSLSSDQVLALGSNLTLLFETLVEISNKREGESSM